MGDHDHRPDAPAEPVVSDLTGFEGWTVVSAPAGLAGELPMLRSPDGREAVRLDLAEAVTAHRDAVAAGTATPESFGSWVVGYIANGGCPPADEEEG